MTAPLESGPDDVIDLSMMNEADAQVVTDSLIGQFVNRGVNLAIAQEICDSVPEGPWDALPLHEIYGNPPPPGDPGAWAWGVVERGEDDPPYVETSFAGREMAEFIAEARTWMPALIADLREARRRITALADRLDEVMAYHDGDVDHVCTELCDKVCQVADDLRAI